jgi:hypothetical protein
MASKKKARARRQRQAKKSRPTTAGKRTLNVVSDFPDLRDRMYEPTLAPLRSRVDPPANLVILDQKSEGSCTGFGLAAVINQLSRSQSGRAAAAGSKGVSPRMLYEMARRFDEWKGEKYSGSSCRGAIKGWYNMGVCRETTWPYVDGKPDTLTVERAKEARNISIGAYYRVRPVVVDYHAAINEAGAIYVSADVHEGWMRPAATPSRLSATTPKASTCRIPGAPAGAARASRTGPTRTGRRTSRMPGSCSSRCRHRRSFRGSRAPSRKATRASPTARRGAPTSWGTSCISMTAASERRATTSAT